MHAFVLTALVAILASAEIIDRIAVSVERRVITESEILRQIRITAFLNNEPPNFTSESKRATADRLVEQLLIRREVETSKYAAPAETAKEMYAELRQHYKSEEEYKRALERYEIRDTDVDQALQWQATLLEFINVRFRPGIQVPESDVKGYYESQVLPKLKPGEKLSVEEATDDITAILTQQRVDSALDRWLGQMRTQTKIRYREEVFR